LSPLVDSLAFGGLLVDQTGDELDVCTRAAGPAELLQLAGGSMILVDRLIDAIGIDPLQPGQARSTALSGLAVELPAALLARLLEINISVAVARQRASAGDWTRCAADYSRRGNPNTSPNLRTMIVRESYSETFNIRLRQNTPT
jgi:hypothetical protein